MFRSHATEAQKKEIFDRYQTLGEDCGGVEAGILFLQVAHNLDQRKGMHMVEVAIFRDAAALQAFRKHPWHQELTNILGTFADWAAGDINISLADLPRPPIPQPQGFSEEELNRN
ncbi:hypothetical protein A3F55_00985 [Candidatus Adlerbacteria bacterium RIFCSPHIGHO2_12_FULL_53_18]|uniref:Stress-response A/B barrel domain-containing protein n=1 Tax=Candidatus Adlerbacteria bacterium RIFCSPHIGHO2_12_FULL_53_18 TaxID=1797242 RepID=A0A1F4XU35_9BACT|nr:MAG: hypothetical protein A3F55_00985 [Candidatus Adlerbacteria bacterium RIFCSPHIGHO2_12_FULL_53_18]